MSEATAVAFLCSPLEVHFCMSACCPHLVVTVVGGSSLQRGGALCTAPPRETMRGVLYVA